jgi:hypothetical protein
MGIQHQRVTKKSGQTTDVVVDLVGASFEKQGVAYTVATFHNAPKAHTSTSHSHHNPEIVSSIGFSLSVI